VVQKTFSCFQIAPGLAEQFVMRICDIVHERPLSVGAGKAAGSKDPVHQPCFSSIMLPCAHASHLIGICGLTIFKIQIKKGAHGRQSGQALPGAGQHRKKTTDGSIARRCSFACMTLESTPKKTDHER
jgi:hypothetical protein